MFKLQISRKKYIVENSNQKEDRKGVGIVWKRKWYGKIKSTK